MDELISRPALVEKLTAAEMQKWVRERGAGEVYFAFLKIINEMPAAGKGVASCCGMPYQPNKKGTGPDSRGCLGGYEGCRRNTGG